jgi:hypothetical protein
MTLSPYCVSAAFNGPDYNITLSRLSVMLYGWRVREARAEQADNLNPHSPDNALSFGAACAIQI